MQPMVNIALRAARKAGEIIARAAEQTERLKIETKGTNDFVTDIDRAAEREIVYHIQKAYPDHAILGEESGLSDEGNSDYQWVIDPLDGTTNFVRGIPHYCVSIACLHKGVIEHAVILDPIRQEEFTASRGRGAQLNGRRIRVSNLTSLEGALLGTGIPYKNRNDHLIPAYTASIAAVASQSAGIRRAGAAALDLAYLAAGRLDGFWEVGLNKWDIAAGILLIKEAGGLVSDFQGGNQFYEDGNIVAANPKVLKPLLQTLKPHLGQVGK
jgi:myo-inositol-1(or 4)-monophosphatase